MLLLPGNHGEIRRRQELVWGKSGLLEHKSYISKKRVEESYYRGPEELINALAGGTIADSLRPALT